MCEVGAAEQGEFQPRLQIEERDRAMFEFAADDAVGFQAEAVAVKPQRGFQIVDA